MKKRKGFTLIELLAVIVVLAVIALIATPLILNVIKKSKIGSAEVSASGYVEAIYNVILENAMEGNKINDGNYTIADEIFKNIQLKGTGPTEGKIVIENEKVKEANLCFSGISIQYKNNVAKYQKNNPYCNGNYNYNVILNVLGNQMSKKIGVASETTFEIDKNQETEWTNIGCNEGAIPSYENGIVTIHNIKDDTICQLTKSLQETVELSNSTETHIVMLNDEIVSDTILVSNDKNVILDIHGKIIKNDYTDDINLFKNQGRLTIHDSTNAGVMELDNVNAHLFWNEGKLTVNSGNFYSNYHNYKSGHPTVIINRSNQSGEVIQINGGQFYGYHIISNDRDSTITLNNNVKLNSTDATILNTLNGNIMISGGSIYNSDKNSTIYNKGNGTISINNSDITSVSRTSPVIYNETSGTITINQTKIESTGEFINDGVVTNMLDGTIYINNSEILGGKSCGIVQAGTGIITVKETRVSSNTANSSTVYNNSSGTIVFENSNVYHSYISQNNGGTWRQAAIRNNFNGTIQINGGSYISDASSSIYNNGTGVINIKSGKFYGISIFGDGHAIIHNNSAGMVNICSGTLEGGTYDLKQESGEGKIKYKSGIQWSTGISPLLPEEKNILLDNSITCQS